MKRRAQSCEGGLDLQGTFREKFRHEAQVITSRTAGLIAPGADPSRAPKQFGGHEVPAGDIAEGGHQLHREPMAIMLTI